MSSRIKVGRLIIIVLTVFCSLVIAKVKISVKYILALICKCNCNSLTTYCNVRSKGVAFSTNRKTNVIRTRDIKIVKLSNGKMCIGNPISANTYRTS